MLFLTILTNSYLGHVKVLVGKLLDKHLRLKHIISITIDMMFCKTRQYGIIIVVVFIIILLFLRKWSCRNPTC